ncbi:hypothetical protein CTI12_AA358680 [Artemisia annua]|uniref:Sororin C-terminal region domain-containing protein n=1 Tax=Artemisia annua TaxID=35608 RepID=A0A2U1MNQ5_ARTAN|nr:hypothetical protein CTI12_AA358680 [Artemisia annua]
MDQAEQQPQRRRMVNKSSSITARKPLANLTNIVRQANKATPVASDSSIGSTQNPIIPKLTRDQSVGDENRIEYTGKQITKNTRSKTKAAVPLRQTSLQQTTNNGKERSVPVCSSTLEKSKDQAKVNQSCLGKTKNDGNKVSVPVCSSTLEKTKDSVKVNQSSLGKTKNDGNKISVAPDYPSMETIKNKRKAIDVPSSTHQMKNANNKTDTHILRSAVNINDKGKENPQSSSRNSNINMGIMSDSVMMRKDKGKAIAEPLDARFLKSLNTSSNMMEARVPLKGVVIRERGESDVPHSAVNIKDKGKDAITDSLMKRKDKGKAIAEPVDHSYMKKLKNHMMDFRVPLKGVIIRDREELVSGSSVEFEPKDKGKMVGTPINYITLEKKDKLHSCPPPLRTPSNRTEADGPEGIIQCMPQTEPPPNKKKRRCSAKEEYTLPQEYVEQQRAYFKEIDDYELEVEEV